MSHTEAEYFKSKMSQGSMPMPEVSIENDSEFRLLVQHVLDPAGESLGEFVARTGLGKGQILSEQMTASDITNFVQQSAQRNRDEIPMSVWKPKPVPAKFILD